MVRTLLGRRINGWYVKDGGMHIDLDDGRTVVVAGAFVVGIMEADKSHLH